MTDMILNLGISQTNVPLQDVPENTFFESDGKVYYRADDGIVYPVPAENVHFSNAAEAPESSSSPPVVPAVPIPHISVASPFWWNPTWIGSQDVAGNYDTKLYFSFPPSYDESNYLLSGFPDSLVFCVQIALDTGFTNIVTLLQPSVLPCTGETIPFLDLSSTLSNSAFINEILGYHSQFVSTVAAKPFSHMRAYAEFKISEVISPYGFGELYIRGFLLDTRNNKRSQYSNVEMIQEVKTAYPPRSMQLPLILETTDSGEFAAYRVKALFFDGLVPNGENGVLTENHVYTTQVVPPEVTNFIGDIGNIAFTFLPNLVDLNLNNTFEIAWYDPLDRSISGEWTPVTQVSTTRFEAASMSFPNSLFNGYLSNYSEDPNYVAVKELFFKIKVTLGSNNQTFYFYGDKVVSASVHVSKYTPTNLGSF